jgi:subtilase family serine protease
MSSHAGTASRVLVAAAAITALALPATGASAAPSPPSAHAMAAGQVTYRRACPAPSRGRVACLAIVDSSTAGQPLTRAGAAAAGLHPYQAADLQAAYHLPSALLGEHQTVAIVDAYDDPNAETDLTAYRKANNLPTCTTANRCFEKVNQTGGTSYPGPDPTAGWEVEESLDLDMVSAICPNCKIILVEANNATDASVYAAVDEAAKLGANVISNSYGTGEFAGEAADCQHYDHPGIAVTASGGDSAFGVNFPAACPSVTAVGGTTLYQDSNARGWAETAWSLFVNPFSGAISGTGSGCSAYIPKPAWQHDRQCGMRTTNDVAAVADPHTPVAVYDTYETGGTWLAVGGTSVSAPLIAAVYALAGNTATIGPGASHIYAHHKDLYDITSGSNGDCGGSYLCTARRGYDGPTGWGTPDGIGAF